MDRLSRAGDGALPAVQLVLARGVRLDWFEFDRDRDRMPDRGASHSIFFSRTASTTRTPFLNLKLLSDRNYAIGLALVTIYGMLNFTPMVLLPPLLQQQAGYPDALVGQVIGCRGVGMSVGFMIAGLHQPDRPAHQHERSAFCLQAASGFGC